MDAELQRRLAAAAGLSETTPETRPTDASALARAAVETAHTPADKLATLQQYYPDARPVAGSPGQYTFADPTTGKQTFFNWPDERSWGDVAAWGPTAAEVLPGVAGGLVGGPAG